MDDFGGVALALFLAVLVWRAANVLLLIRPLARRRPTRATPPAGPPYPPARKGGAGRGSAARAAERQWLLEQAASPADAVPGLPSALLPGVGSVFSFTFATLANIVFVIFAGLFFALNPKLYLDGLVRLFPPKRRPRARVVVDRVGLTLRAWLLGQLVAMLSAGTLTTLGLLLLGMPSALALVFLAGLFEFIPTI